MSFGDDEEDINDQDITMNQQQNNNNPDEDETYGLGPIYLYRWIDCQDEYNKWYEAQIIDIDPSNSKKILVHYKGWKSKFDHWIDLNSDPERARLLHTFTEKPPYLYSRDIDLNLGAKCDVLDSSDKWYSAQVIAINDNKELVKIHYDQWDSKYDEWINKDSYRIAPLYTKTTKKQSNIQNDDDQNKTQNENENEIEKIDAITPRINNTNNTSTTHKRRVNNSNSSGQIKRKPFKRSNSPLNTTNINAIQPMTSEEEESKINNTNNNNDLDDNTEITQEQREENERIRRNYISNFKPSINDEDKFSSLLSVTGLKIASMGEDGNCLFRSISHQIYGTEEFHLLLRSKCVEYLQSEREYFSNYVPQGHDKLIFDAYCTRMSRDGVWGDNIEIQAFSEIYNRPIEIYAYSDKPMKTFSNDNGKDNKDKEINNNNNNDNNNIIQHKQASIRLSYHCNSHYNSIINPDLHFAPNNLLNPNLVGKVEDDRIRLSYLRSTHASQASIILSDIEATDLEFYKQILSKSRKEFDEKNISNQQLDVAIKESLKQFEKDTMENVMEQSIKDQEKYEMEKALKASLKDYNINDDDDDDDEQNRLLLGDYNNNDNLTVITNEYIKAVINKGYSIEQATLAWSTFESKENILSKNDLIEKMIDYIKNTQVSLMFSEFNDYY